GTSSRRHPEFAGRSFVCHGHALQCTCGSRTTRGEEGAMSDRVLRCDLHVHSRHSGPATLPLLGRLADECYSEPEQVYEQARRRGMDLVTLTDHDTIEGALRLAGRPDTFVSEE